MARTSFADYQATRYFFPLDGLRALSAALVVTWHTRDSPLEFLQGERGVTVFFVLSGYLITMLALREEESKGSLSISGFFLRRVFRILPLYYIVLFGYAALVYLFEDDKVSDFNAALPYYMLYLSEIPLLWNHVEVPFNHSWSLGIEEKFYAVWPFLAFGWMKSSKLRLPMSLLLGGGLLFGGFLQPEFGTPMALLEPYGHILIGAAMAFALHDKKWFERLGFLQNPAMYWVFGILCVVLGVTESRWAFELLAVPTALFVGAMVLQPRHAISRLLGFGPLAWLGTLSYAIYLIHPGVLGFAERLVPSVNGRLDDLITLIIGYSLSIVISVFLHRAIEKPFIKWGRKFDKSRRPPGSDSASVAIPSTPATIDLMDKSAESVAEGRDNGASEPAAPTSHAMLTTPPTSSVKWSADVGAGRTHESALDSALDSALESAVPEGSTTPLGSAQSGESFGGSDVAFVKLPPPVAWGSDAWVTARGTATMRRSASPTSALVSTTPVVSPVPAPPTTQSESQDPAIPAPNGAEPPDRSNVSEPPAALDAAPESRVADLPEPSPAGPGTDVTKDHNKGPFLWGVLGVIAIAVLAAFGYFFGPDSSMELVAPARIDDVRVDGPMLIDGSGSPVRLQGVTQGGSQYACAQGWGIFDGAANQSSATAMTEWGINAVRLPLNEHCWLGTQGFAAEYSGASYQRGIVKYVDILRAQGHAVILSLDWSGIGPDAATGQGILPNKENSVRFWESVAAQIDQRPGVIFELFASPESNEGACLGEGCVVDGTSYSGFQTLIDAVRNTGSTQPLLLTAPAPGVSVSMIDALEVSDPLDQLIVGFKAVDDFADAACVGIDCWSEAAEQAAVDNVDATRPLLAISLRSADCSAEGYSSTLEYLESLSVSVFVPGWNTWDACGETPGLLADDSFAPTPVGEAVQRNFR